MRIDYGASGPARGARRVSTWDVTARNLRRCGLSHRERGDLIRMLQPYFLRPEETLDRALVDRNLMLTGFADDASRAFLLVRQHAEPLVIDGVRYRCTHLGLAAVDRYPISPLFRAAKACLTAQLGEGEPALIYLTTASPYAYRSVRTAYGNDVWPSEAFEGPPEQAIASALRARVGAPPARSSESPFALFEHSLDRYTPAEQARIDAFLGPTPIARHALDAGRGDQLIIFHRFKRTRDRVSC